MRLIHFLLIASAVIPTTGQGQSTFLDLPRTSQMASVTQRIGTTNITVDYSRPAVNGRKIFGEVVRFDQVWRAGANENTTITFTDPVTIGNTTVGAGIYGLHMLPQKDAEWIVILSKDHDSWGSFYYDKANDACRISVTPKSGPRTELLTYAFETADPQSTTLVMKWDDVTIPITIKADVHSLVLGKMDAQLKGLSSFSWEPWYEAAQYAHQEKLNAEQALKWINRSVSIRPNFSNQMLKSEILHVQGKETEASVIREEALSLATNAELNQYGYVLLNQGKNDEAIKIFALNVKRYPKDPNVHDSLGEAYMTAGKNDLAEKSFRKCLSMDPPEAVKNNSIRCLKEMGVDI